MTAIYKYLLQRQTIILLPVGARVLSAGAQDGVLKACVLRETKNDIPMEHAIFNVYSTGEAIDLLRDDVFVSAVFDGPFVWHVFVTWPERVNGVHPSLMTRDDLLRQYDKVVRYKGTLRPTWHEVVKQEVIKRQYVIDEEK